MYLVLVIFPKIIKNEEMILKLFLKVKKKSKFLLKVNNKVNFLLTFLIKIIEHKWIKNKILYHKSKERVN